MNKRKITVIIHETDEKLCAELTASLKKVVVPNKFSLEIKAVKGAERFAAYEQARRSSDAKYKIYLDEHLVIVDENFLVELLNIFKGDGKIGAVSTSGAIRLSTNGAVLKSANRTNKNYSGEVDMLDCFFIATQYDLPWRHERYKDCVFGTQAQCMELRRAGCKLWVAAQDKPWIAHAGIKFKFKRDSCEKFLDDYSADLFPLVTVIIPTFNRPQYFKEALDSALNQTYRNIEVVISDNSTDDATERLVAGYDDKRIKYFRHKNFDAHDNWNFARSYNNPAAEYVNWLMDDDRFYPTKLEQMVDVYRNNPEVSLVTSAKDYIDATGKVIGKSKALFKDNVTLTGNAAGRLLFLWDNYIGEPTTVLIRKKFLRDNDLCWNEDERGFFSLVDVSTWLQLLSKGKLFRFTESLSCFRHHKQQATYWKSTYALTPVSWIKLLKIAWDRKIFIQTEREFKLAAMRLTSTAINRLFELSSKNVATKEVETLRRTFFATVDSLRNGCKLELPAIEYSEQDTVKKIR